MRHPRFFVVASVLAVVLGPASPLLAGTPEEKSSPQPAGRRPLSENIWWNQPRVYEALGLSAEQRAKMDKTLDDRVDARREQAMAYQQHRHSFADAIRAGDFAAARTESDALGGIAATMARAETEIVLDVMALLSADQRAKLNEEFPTLLRRSWLMAARGRGMAAARGGPGSR